MLKLYKGLVRPYLEYCSHVWGACSYAYLLDRIKSKAIHLIGDASVTSSLDSLSLHSKVASFSLSFISTTFCCCSYELAGCIPPPLVRLRNMRQAISMKRYAVELCNPRVGGYNECFFYSTSLLWNSLPNSVFASSYNHLIFKRQVYLHL